jgi:hypothetical protein
LQPELPRAEDHLEENMAIEMWGTFSVRDHAFDRAFIADVLLYDRLVIPTLPGSDAETDWPVEWDIKKQKSLLALFGQDFHTATPDEIDRAVPM